MPVPSGVRCLWGWRYRASRSKQNSCDSHPPRSLACLWQRISRSAQSYPCICRECRESARCWGEHMWICMLFLKNNILNMFCVTELPASCNFSFVLCRFKDDWGINTVVAPWTNVVVLEILLGCLDYRSLVDISWPPCDVWDWSYNLEGGAL